MVGLQVTHVHLRGRVQFWIPSHAFIIGATKPSVSGSKLRYLVAGLCWSPVTVSVQLLGAALCLVFGGWWLFALCVALYSLLSRLRVTLPAHHLCLRSVMGVVVDEAGGAANRLLVSWFCN